MTFRRLTSGCGVLALVSAAEVALYSLGGRVLVGPRLDQPGSWPTWLLTRPPDMAMMALVRLLTLALGAYLVAVVGAGLALRALHLRRLVANLDRLTPPTVREVLDRLTGVAAAGVVAMAGVAGTAGPATAAPAGAAAPVHGPSATTYGPPVTLRGLAGPQPDPAPTTTTVVKPIPIVSPPATLPPQRQRITPRDLGELPDEVAEDLVGPPGTDPPRQGPPPSELGDVPGGEGDSLPGAGEVSLPPERRRVTPDRGTAQEPAPAIDAPQQAAGAPPGGATGETGTPPRATGSAGASAPAASTPPTASPADATATPTWKVEAGDHFWSIAERLLADSWGRRPSATEIDPYWRLLVEANRDRLADRGNADLLFPGQLLALPPVPVRPAA